MTRSNGIVTESFKKTTEQYRSGWDRIFGGNNEMDKATTEAIEELDNKRQEADGATVKTISDQASSTAGNASGTGWYARRQRDKDAYISNRAEPDNEVRGIL